MSDYMDLLQSNEQAFMNKPQILNYKKNFTLNSTWNYYGGSKEKEEGANNQNNLIN